MRSPRDDKASMWQDRDRWLPFDPPGLRRRGCTPDRCWELRWRDRLGWWLFCLVADQAHVAVVWQTFRSTRKSRRTTWTFSGGGSEDEQDRVDDTSSAQQPPEDLAV